MYNIYADCTFRSHDAAASAEVTRQRQAFVAVETALQEQLDPIDWATYEPHLWANVARFSQRAATLFGSLAVPRTRQPEVKSIRSHRNIIILLDVCHLGLVCLLAS